MTFDPTEHPHRRYNALTGEYTLVSPHRMKRPWQGTQEHPAVDERPQHDPNCYLCAGNTRISGETNPNYTSTFVFTNDFQALLPNTPDLSQPSHPLLKTKSLQGTCRVICFSPRHDLTLTEMARDDIRIVVDIWAEQTTELGAQYKWVQVFENKGKIMGCSNPHPHGQIWAESALPNEAAKEDQQQREYYEKQGSQLLLDYTSLELDRQERIVVENDDWLALVPFWAMWPFEMLLIPRRHVATLPDLNDRERDSLADILKRMLTRYDNLFEVSFPYSMGWHGAPFGQEDYRDYWQLHAHFYPPLLRSATIKKFMVGYEMLAEGQRDLTAEQATDRLRSLSEIHYKHGSSA